MAGVGGSMGIGIVSPEELIAERVGRFAGAAIFDTRGREAFLAGHISGSMSMTWESWCAQAPDDVEPTLKQSGYWGVVAPIAPVDGDERLADLDLQDGRPIVVYADGPRTRGREARIAWMLLYFGACNVWLLDGGWTGWLASGGNVQAGEAAHAVRPVGVCLRPERRRQLHELREAYHQGTLPVLIDARSQAEFEGEIQEYLPRRGHLPGARLVPFADCFDADGRYVPREFYLTNLVPGIRDAVNMVTYCEVGVRACLFALLHEVYTGIIVPVYDGSLMEWSLQPDLPMERLTSQTIS